VLLSPARSTSPLHARLLALAAALAVMAGLLVASGTATAPSAQAAAVKVTVQEKAFVTKINAERKKRGLRPLVLRADLVSVARAQSKRMASKTKLYHNPRLAKDVRNYRWVGENVGYGPTVVKLHTAFMKSPSHRANLLDRGYREVGIGIVKRGKTIWVTEVFRQPR
jgi:uncharacterized protein YkwD